jgi:hypothetical protein
MRSLLQNQNHAPANLIGEARYSGNDACSASPVPPVARARRQSQRLADGKRLSLVQARLNDNERERLNSLRQTTGLSDSALVRAALEELDRTLKDRAPSGANQSG